jgi:hypothetical protein
MERRAIHAGPCASIHILGPLLRVYQPGEAVPNVTYQLPPVQRIE